MKTKTQKRKEALARRESDLSKYEKGKLPKGCKRTDLKRKLAVCKADIRNLLAKLA